MKSTFVRCLWGDRLIDRRDTMIAEPAKCRAQPLQAEPTIFVAFGCENERIAMEAGWQTLLASSEAVLNLAGANDRNAERSYGMFPFGVNMYVHKLLAMKAVLESGADEAVFLDLETTLLQPLPPDFWPSLQAGREFQAPLYTYHTRHCKWRKRWLRTVPAANGWYCRSVNFLDDVVGVMIENPDWSEETAFGRVVENMLGEDFTPERYVQAGFFFPWFKKEFAQIIEPREAVFGTVKLKGWSRMRKRGVEAWEEYCNTERTGDSETLQAPRPVYG